MIQQPKADQTDVGSSRLSCRSCTIDPLSKRRSPQIGQKRQTFPTPSPDLLPVNPEVNRLTPDFVPPLLQKPRYTGAVDALRKTVTAEGAKGLYKGMGAPLATVAVFNAVLFTVRGQMESLLRTSPGENLTVGQQFVAGSGAGVGAALVACPTELIKCRLQVG